MSIHPNNLSHPFPFLSLSLSVGFPLSVCLFVYLPIYVSLYFVCLSICLAAHLSFSLYPTFLSRSLDLPATGCVFPNILFLPCLNVVTSTRAYR